ncbi:MAG: TSUP family transporter [Magnetococcales bacterium]|nr:TSUP family transporter [Magnetococcales bacterium]
MTIHRTSKGQSAAYPFCRQPWHIGAMLLGVCFVFTMFWAFHLLHDDLEESLEYLRLGKKSASREAKRAETPVVPAAFTAPVAALSPSTRPADLRVRAALVNIAGIRSVKGGPPGQFASTGSGVLVTANGYVATAAHVVAGLTEILVRVQTPSGPRQYTAQMVKTAPDHDVAILKLASRDIFPYLPLVPNALVPKPGAPVQAWGDPDSTNAMANQGQVQQVEATTVVEGVTLTHLLRTDAVTHWSQSGGPLLDAQGRLVGINIAANGGLLAGGSVGYAVPADVLWAHFQDVVNFPQVNQAPVLPATVPVAAAAQASMVPVAAQTGSNTPGGRDPRRADTWWAQAQAAFGVVQPGGLASPSGGPGVGLHVAAQAGAAPPVMVPAVHVTEPLLWGYPLETLLGLLALGLVSGISGGMMTMGGGIIKVTGLMLFFGYGLLLIRPVAYITNIFLYGAAVLRYRRYNLILWESVRGLIPWAMVGVVMGYFLGNVIGNQWIRYLLGLFAALVGIRMLVEILSGSADEPPDGRPRQHWLYYLGIVRVPVGERAPLTSGVTRDGVMGLPMGLISGILGITGGVLEVPLQRYVAGLPLRNAIANSAVLVFFASLVGSIVAMTHGIQTGAFDWSAPIKLAVILIPGAYAGGLIGAWLTKVVPLGVLRWLYAVLMFVIAVRMVLS